MNNTNYLKSDTSHPKQRAYIAAPFFNPIQVERVEFIKSVLDKQGISYYSPKDEKVVSPTDTNKLWRKEVFESNVDNIIYSDFMIAITNDKDIGTIFEAGVAYHANIPIIYFAENLDGQFNLMLAESALAVFTNRDSLSNYNFHELSEKSYEGDIE